MPRTSSLIESDQGGLPPIIDDLPPGGGGPGDHSNDRAGDPKTSLIGILVLLFASTMTFLALVSALVVRRGLGSDWKTLSIPPVLYWNTAVLLASSVALHIAGRALKKGQRVRFNWWWSAGTLLGLAFLAGQSYAWLQLRSRGVFVATNPSPSFFYVLTWTHAVHAIGGLIALLYVGWQAFRFRLGPRKRTAVSVSTVFWHFLDVLWICLMLLFVYAQ